MQHHLLQGSYQQTRLKQDKSQTQFEKSGFRNSEVGPLQPTPGDPDSLKKGSLSQLQGTLCQP